MWTYLLFVVVEFPHRFVVRKLTLFALDQFGVVGNLQMHE